MTISKELMSKAALKRLENPDELTFPHNAQAYRLIKKYIGVPLVPKHQTYGSIGLELPPCEKGLLGETGVTLSVPKKWCVTN